MVHASAAGTGAHPPGRAWLKWVIAALIGLINLYAVTLMYVRGETLFALVVLVLVAAGLYVFTAERTYVHRYIFPGVATMAIFIVFPLAYTVWISFTNYSAANILTFERARDYRLAQTFQVPGQRFEFTLSGAGPETYRLALTGSDGAGYLSAPFALSGSGPRPAALAAAETIDLDLEPADPPETAPVPLRELVALRHTLRQVRLHLPDGTDLRMTSLREFAAVRPLYQVLPAEAGGDGLILVNQETGGRIAPDLRTGFYRALDAAGEFTGPGIAPGFTAWVGWQNFLRVLTDPGVQGPFLQIFGWTLVFSFLSVLFTLALGMLLAALVQWEALGGRGLYRLLLILPYAVPAFISILVFRGLFNANFGEINLLLGQLFGIKPAWFDDPTLARTMLLIVNTWLGYPYMMILCMGLLKAIPSDLYEASAMDGSNFVRDFFSITVPLLMKPLTPLLIASFAFNFNNFVLVQLLTQGRPDIIGAQTPAGTTDLLVTYTYRIAFEGSGQDYGLAAAIATLIFIMVGVLALINIRVMRIDRPA